MDDEPARRSRMLAAITTIVALASIPGLLAMWDKDGPISELPLTLLGLVLVVVASGVALLGVIRCVLLTLAIRRYAARWSTSDPSE